MKLLYIQDAHLKGKNSRNRLGNYFDDCLKKIDEVIKIAKDNKCSAILDGGDLFESYNPSYSVLDALADRIDKAKIYVYSLFGNHCMNIGHINNTGLSHLQKRSKWFKPLDKHFYLDDTNENIIIKGFDYYYGIEDDIRNNGLMVDGKDTAWKIAITHATITEKKFFEEVSHITPDKIKTDANLVLIAHIHKPYKKIVNNTTFLNIGCLCRDNIDEAKIEPSVLIIDTDKRDYEVIKLKSAKKANEIFDLSKYEELKASKKGIKEFLDSLRDVNFQSLNLGETITKIGKEQRVDKNIIDYLLNKMENINE